MKRMLLLVCALVASGIAHAQEQEEPGSLIDRIDSKRRRALQAMDAGSKGDPSLTSPLVSKSFNAGAFSTQSFSTETFGGTKTAKTKSFETRSFFGIKNPWFGRKVYDTGSAKFKRDVAVESQESYATDSYGVRKFRESSRTDVGVASEILPANTAPRKYLGPENPNKGEGIDQFTQNLDRDLSMDEVRDLLNKGRKAK